MFCFTLEFSIICFSFFLGKEKSAPSHFHNLQLGNNVGNGKHNEYSSEHNAYSMKNIFLGVFL